MQHKRQITGNWLTASWRTRSDIQFPQKENKSKSSIASLDGVRAIAFLIVLGFHIDLISRDTHLWVPTQNYLYSAIALSGASGVQLFFVLSGFLLFLPYAKALMFEKEWPSARTFYLRRALRILPAYYVSLFLMILIWHPEYLRQDHLTDLGFFLALLTDAPSTFQKIDGPFWTLAVEWQFYLLLPLLALGMRGLVWLVQRLINCGGRDQSGPYGAHQRWLSRRGPYDVSPRRGAINRAPMVLIVVGCLFALIAWGAYSDYWGPYLVNHPSQTFLVPRSVLNNLLIVLYGSHGKSLEVFSIGMLLSLCYVLTQSRPAQSKLNNILRHLSYWTWALGIALLALLAVWRAHTWNLFVGIGYYTIYDQYYQLGYGLGFGLCLTTILFGPAAFRRIFEWNPLRGVGIISFSLYMWHLPLLILLIPHINGRSSTSHYLLYALIWAWVLVVIIPFSFMVYTLVEKPWMDLSEKWLKKKRPVPNTKNEQSLVPPQDKLPVEAEPVGSR